MVGAGMSSFLCHRRTRFWAKKFENQLQSEVRWTGRCVGRYWPPDYCCSYQGVVGYSGIMLATRQIANGESKLILANAITL